MATAAVGGYLGFRNTSASACWLSGWPGLTALTAGGHKVAARQALATAFGPAITAPPKVALEPGAVAEAVFSGNNVLGACAQGTLPVFRSIQVVPPGGGGPVTLSALLPGTGQYLPDCGGQLLVTPVVPAADLYVP